jgi:hypothetical protein
MSTLKAKKTFTYLAHGICSNALEQTKCMRIIVCWNSTRSKDQCAHQFKFVNEKTTYDPCTRGLNVLTYLSVMESVWESSIHTRPRINLNYSSPTVFPIKAKNFTSIGSSEKNNDPNSTLDLAHQGRETRILRLLNQTNNTTKFL